MESIRLNCLYFSTSMFQIDPQPHSQQHQYLFIPYIVGPDETLCLWLSQPVSAPKTINFYHVFVYLLSFPEIYFRITREFMFILRYFSNLKFNAFLTITRFFCVLELVQDYSWAFLFVISMHINMTLFALLCVVQVVRVYRRCKLVLYCRLSVLLVLANTSTVQNSTYYSSVLHYVSTAYSTLECTTVQRSARSYRNFALIPVHSVPSLYVTDVFAATATLPVEIYLQRQLSSCLPQF